MPNKLSRLYERFNSDDSVLITITADPDAIGSAIAMKRLLWRRVGNITIARTNDIKRPDNLAMIRLLKVKIVHINDIDVKLFDKFIILDSQPNHHPLFGKFSYDVVIDHHPKTDVEAPYIDIRSEYGSTSTIMTEYMKSAKIKISANIATGLFYGIKVDTMNFERQGIMEDIKAFQYLFKFINIYVLRKIESSELRIDFLKYYKIALQTMCLRRKRTYVFLGPVMNPDVCVLIADFFTKVHSVTWSIISGICNNELTIIFRNDGLRKDAGKIAKQGFGQIGSAGGHKSMARAQIPVSNLEGIVDINDEKKVLRWLIQSVEFKADK